MCWAKSHIPRPIWQAGEANSNLIESVHADVNREGIACTLLGGLTKGHHFDIFKMRTLKVIWGACYDAHPVAYHVALQAFEDNGIRPSYKTGHSFENAEKSLKRKGFQFPRDYAIEHYHLTIWK